MVRLRLVRRSTRSTRQPQHLDRRRPGDPLWFHVAKAAVPDAPPTQAARRRS
jgi:hypothetical protein